NRSFARKRKIPLKKSTGGLDIGIGSIPYTVPMYHKTDDGRPLRPAELAQISGVSTDTLRHYERLELLHPTRRANGYRDYPPGSIKRVATIRRAITLGFRLEELARILAVRDSGGAPCRKVRSLAAGKLVALE